VFLDKGVRYLLEGKGQEFIEYYYEYLQIIFDMKIPLKQIAQRAKVKLTLDDYAKRSTQRTKGGAFMSKMAHMELALKHKLKVSLGDVISYVNNGTRASHGDVQKKGDTVQLNCYMLDVTELENNPDMTGEYNIPRAIATFNKRIQPLLVVFKEEVRKGLLVTDPEQRGFFTKEQCQLVNGLPFKESDQDTVEDLLTISENEVKYWDKVGIDPNYIYELAEPGWEDFI
jgi:hypothetical protein